MKNGRLARPFFFARAQPFRCAGGARYDLWFDRAAAAAANPDL